VNVDPSCCGRTTRAPLPLSQPNVVSAAPEASLWEDFVDIIVDPVSVFRRREHANWLIPLAIVTVAIAIIAIASRGVLQPMMDAEFERAADAMRKNPQVTEEMIDRMHGVMLFTQTWGPVVLTPIGIILVGFVTWFISKFVDAHEALSTAMMIASYAYVPRIIQFVVNAVQGLFLKPDQMNGIIKLSFSPARFLDPNTANPVLLQVLNRFDIFTIWVTVLLAIGIYATGKVSKHQAAIAGILIWIVGAIPAVLGALRQAASAS
jgi:membrane protein, antimicrobial resistance system